MEALVGAACMATGRPVYLEYDYQQFIAYTGKRSPFWMHGKMAADKDGKLLAMETDWSVDHGPYSEFGDLLTLRGAQYMGAGYDLPSIRGIGRTVATNHAWGSAFRAYGSPQSFLMSESLMDELAEKIGMDPLEFRYKNVYRPGATTPTGQVPDSMSFPEMFDILRPLYKAAKEKAQAESTPEKKKGVGVSLGIYGAGLDGADGSEAWVEITKEGVTVYATWHDHGQGADMGAVGTAHEALRALEVEPEQIKLVLNDTGLTPNSGPAGGSRSQVVVGNSIKNACENLIESMRKSDGSLRTYDEMVADSATKAATRRRRATSSIPTPARASPTRTTCTPCSSPRSRSPWPPVRRLSTICSSAPTSASSTAASTSTDRCGAVSPRGSGSLFARTSTISPGTSP